MDKMKKNNLKKIVIISLLIICLLYLKSKVTYTSYESKVDATVNAKIAKWKILVNDTLITSDTQQEIKIDNINWTTNHTREGKTAPGSKGYLTLIIDPKTTEVAIDYELKIIDKKIDANKILTATYISTNNYDLIKNNDTYTATFPLSDIKSGKKEVITIFLEWIEESDTTEVPKEELTSDDFIEISFKAMQKK